MCEALPHGFVGAAHFQRHGNRGGAFCTLWRPGIGSSMSLDPPLSTVAVPHNRVEPIATAGGGEVLARTSAWVLKSRR